MGANVVLAVSLKLAPVGNGDLNNILGVLQRAFAVGIEVNEERDRKLANVVITPDVSGFNAASYLKVVSTRRARLRRRRSQQGRAAQVLAQPKTSGSNISRSATPVCTDLRATFCAWKSTLPTPAVKAVAERLFAPLVDQPVDTERIAALLSQLRSDGRYDADYTVGYDRTVRGRPILLVTVKDKPTGPPFLEAGFNLEAQTGGVTRATVNTILLYQDLGGYGSSCARYVDFGFLTRASKPSTTARSTGQASSSLRAPTSRARRTTSTAATRGSPSASLRSPAPAQTSAGATARTQEIRAGWQLENVRWYITTGFDGLPDYRGNAQTARVQYIYDSQDRALVPHFGIRSQTDLGYLYATPDSPSAPQLSSQIAFSHTFGKKNLLLMNMEGGTMLQPGCRPTLPLHPRRPTAPERQRHRPVPRHRLLPRHARLSAPHQIAARTPRQQPLPRRLLRGRPDARTRRFHHHAAGRLLRHLSRRHPSASSPSVPPSAPTTSASWSSPSANSFRRGSSRRNVLSTLYTLSSTLCLHRPAPSLTASRSGRCASRIAACAAATSYGVRKNVTCSSVSS